MALTASVRFHRSRPISSAFAERAIPAAWISTSSPPNVPTAPATAASTEPLSATSTGKKPSAPASAAIDRPASSEKSIDMTRAPSPGRPLTSPSPIPLAPQTPPPGWVLAPEVGQSPPSEPAFRGLLNI